MLTPADDRPPTSPKAFKRMLENEAAASMFAWLRDRGHVIDEVHWPDREREGHKTQAPGAKTVDLTFLEDGREVGVDIIEMHESQRHARQRAEMDRIVATMEKELAARIRELNPDHTIAISWDIGWLPSREAMRAGLEMVKQAILSAASGMRDGDSLDLDPKPDFVPYVEAHAWASPTPTFGFMSMHAEETGWLGQVAESMAELLLTSSKPTQLKAFADARVLAIDRALMPSAGELRNAFDARRGRVPPNWTAIYFVVVGGPGSFSEVWRP